MDIHKSYVVPFSVPQTYTAWISSDTVIPPATRMDIEPVVGGHYRLFMETAEYTGRNEGRFLVVEPEQHLRYTWEWNGDGEVSEIDVTFAAAPTGTEITIAHTGFQSEESRDNHSSGWDSYVPGFVAFLDGK